MVHSSTSLCLFPNMALINLINIYHLLCPLLKLIAITTPALYVNHACGKSLIFIAKLNRAAIFTALNLYCVLFSWIYIFYCFYAHFFLRFVKFSCTHVRTRTYSYTYTLRCHCYYYSNIKKV